MAQIQEDDGMLPDYSEHLTSMIQNGVRGKYAGRLTRRGNVAVPAPDVSQAYPTDKEVNDALRSLMNRKAEAAR